MVVKNFGDLKSVTGPESLFDPAYTGHHIVLLECQLKTPSQMNLIDHSVLDYLNLQRMNFANWRIVDVDHYMKGNSFFSKQFKDGEWFKSVESVIGTYSERKKEIKDPA